MSALNNREATPTFQSFSNIGAMMLQGQNHDVWRPGKELQKRDSSKKLIEMRRRSLLRQVNAFHGLVSDTASQKTAPTIVSKECPYTGPSEELKQKRAEQWDRIVNNLVVEAVSDDQFVLESASSISASSTESTSPESVGSAASDDQSEDHFVFPEVEARWSSFFSIEDTVDGSEDIGSHTEGSGNEGSSDERSDKEHECFSEGYSGDESDDDDSEWMYQIQYYETTV